MTCFLLQFSDDGRTGKVSPVPCELTDLFAFSDRLYPWESTTIVGEMDETVQALQRGRKSGTFVVSGSVEFCGGSVRKLSA